MVHKDGDFLHIFMFQKDRDLFAHMGSYHKLNTKPRVLANLDGYYSGNNNIYNIYVYSTHPQVFDIFFVQLSVVTSFHIVFKNW